MKKLFSYLLVLAIVLSLMAGLSACGKADTSSEALVSGDETESVISETSEAEVNTSSTVTSKPEEQTPSDNKTPETSMPTNTKPAEPVKLNPKTNLKFDKYYKTEFFGEDGKSFHIIRLSFYEYEDLSDNKYALNGVTFSETNYYNKEYSEKQYSDWGSEFKEEDFNQNEYIIKNNVKYFNLGTGGSCLDAYDLTDTSIKLISGDDTDILYIKENGDLVIESVTTDNRYGAVGTVFKLEE